MDSFHREVNNVGYSVRLLKGNYNKELALSKYDLSYYWDSQAPKNTRFVQSFLYKHFFDNRNFLSLNSSKTSKLLYVMDGIQKIMMKYLLLCLNKNYQHNKSTSSKIEWWCDSHYLRSRRRICIIEAIFTKEVQYHFFLRRDNFKLKLK